MMHLVWLVTVNLASAEQSPPQESYLLRVAETLELCRGDIGAMTAPADAAAGNLDAGGGLYAGGDSAFVSEMCGRAGGLMLIRPLHDKLPAKGDVVLYAPGPELAAPEGVLASGALVVVVGDKMEAEGIVAFSAHAEAYDISPRLAAAAQGWVFTAELVAALTRRGRMPVMFESIGMYGAYARMDKYLKQGVLYHEHHEVPPIDPGRLGGRYIDVVGAMLRRVEREETDRLSRAAAWAAGARADGHRLAMYSMGHLFPDEIGKTPIGQVFESAPWNAGFLNEPTLGQEYAPGDVLIHIGYQHPPYRLLEGARTQGANVVYVSVLQHRDYVGDPAVIWIDPMWSWCDACMPLEGYDIQILPASGIVNGAIAWEIYRQTVKDSTPR